MKKFTFALILLVSISLLSLKDNETCSGLAGHKALACSACHGGSISSGVFIIDGKVEGEPAEENTFEYTVRIPATDLNFLQLYAAINDDTYGAPRVEVDFTSVLADIKGSTLFNAVNLSQEKSTQGFTEFKVKYAFDEPLTSSRTMTLQGVLSNNDGTVDGDQTFYKEITIEPKDDGIQASNLGLADDQAYYNNGQIIISNPGKTQAVQILDLQGKIVQTTLVEDYQNIDVSQLEQGMYLVLVGNQKKDLQSFKFVK